MEFTAKAIAEFLNGEVVGNPEIKVSNVAKIEEAKAGTLAFLTNPRYTKYLYSTEASIVLINKDFELESPVSATLIKVKNAYESFAKLLELAEQAKPVKQGISSLAFIEKSAKIGDGIYIAPFVYIGENAVIEDNAKLFPHVFIDDNVTVKKNSTLNSGVKVYHECIIGENCIIHAGAIIGSDGFGFAPDENNVYRKIPQLGNVVIEDNVEIGSNTTVDRATMGSTIIKKGVKLDNLIQIGHNVQIGENTVIAAQAGVAGSTKIGKNCMIGGQVGFIGHITIADEVKIAAQSGIGKSITKKGEIVQGSPAFDISTYRRSYVHFRNLPNLKIKLDELEKLVHID